MTVISVNNSHIFHHEYDRTIILPDISCPPFGIENFLPVGMNLIPASYLDVIAIIIYIRSHIKNNATILSFENRPDQFLETELVSHLIQARGIFLLIWNEVPLG